MKRIIIALSYFLMLSKVIASTSLCLYNLESTEMSVALSISNTTTTQKTIPALSSYCRDDLGNKDIVTVYISNPIQGSFTVNQGNSNKKSSINNVKVSNNLYYNLISGNYTNSYTLYNPQQPQIISTNNWMKQLNDNKQLYKIEMPGSHDAGMSQTDHCTFGVPSSWAQTQTLNILDQARAGSRYFDIRPDYDNGQLVTYHRTAGSGCNGEPLENVLDEAVQFLQENPSETVILKISHTRDDVGHKAIDIMPKVISLYTSAKYESYIYTSTKANQNISDDTLGSVRGKIIGVFDVEYASYINPESGIFSYTDSIGLQNTGISLPSPSSTESESVIGLSVFDQYTNTSDYNTMYTDQSNKLSTYAKIGNPYLFLLSWTLTGDVGKADIEQIANTANGHLPGFLYDSKESRVYNRANVVYIDFINSSLNQSIIGSYLHLDTER